MPMSRARGNLIIAAVVVAAVVFYCAYVRAKWKEMESNGGIRSVTYGAGSGLNVRGPKDLKSRVPDWVPLYPGAVPNGLSSSQPGIEHYLDVQLHTVGDCKKVVAWYEQTLFRAGYTTHAKFETEDPVCSSTIQFTGPNFHRSIGVSASGNSNDVLIQLRAVEREVSSGAAPEIPKWVPLYPGAAPPTQFDATNGDSGEYHLAFSFSTADDPTKVCKWYEAQLKKLGFDVTYDARPGTAGQFLSHTRDNKRSLNMHNYPGSADTDFVVNVVDR